MTKSRFLSSVVALAASGAVCASAAASSANTVKIKLPSSSIGPGHHFNVKATGVSASTARLTVFQAKSCKSTAKAEAGIAHELINKSVDHTYSASKVATASKSTGVYYVCGYLTAGSSTRAHTSFKYYDVIGGY